ncbi:MAG: S-methyl-5'-thioinosine phosphorylase [Thermoplasmata archaeon]|nr:MAG: MTAP family purine nucleoside phosphorylase [Thermoplasmata archaeon]RLF33938.1 MAG: S-methyl-5'-thioinosine phosphorylase [Thermoplasmata archaeon]RLF38562.1 MAG: S-methyl-5'-thioinosine phosphorylase [Thermoplasmata archaeon]
MKIGIIGGTGFYETEGSEITVDTNYGAISLFHQEKYERDVLFVPRHGKKKAVPHAVNYHGIIEALHRSGVTAIMALNTVGSMKEEIGVGSLVIPDDFIDFTARKSTFFDDELVHVDMSEPFCPVLRKLALKEASRRCETHEGVYVVTEGPRFETRAEIRMFRTFADVVGMTLSPEVVLAREKGICYASICLVSNYAAGMQKTLDVEEITRVHAKRKKDILAIIDECIKKIPERRNCGCHHAAARGRL